MKLKYISKIVGCLGLALCVSSCDDFLDQSNPNALTTGIYWNSLKDCNEGLTAVYNIFKSDNLLQYRNGLVVSDVAWPNGHSHNAWPKINEPFHMRTYDDTNPYISNQWTNIYMGIFRANQVLEGLANVKETIKTDDDLLQYNQILGQATFFRALFHFYAYCIFNEGNVPLITKVPSGESEFYAPCTKREVVQDFVRSEMAVAESLLPTKGSVNDWEGVDVGRIRSEAASAILGLTYLYENEPAYKDPTKKPNYAEAAKYFKKIIDNSNYKLVGIADNMTELNENNDESILEIQYTLDFNAEYAASSMSNLSSSLAQYVCAPSVGTKGGNRALPAYWLHRAFGVEPVDKTIADNKVYLKTDAHNDIYYWNNDKEYVTSGEDAGGVFVQYFVLKKYNDAELRGKISGMTSTGTTITFAGGKMEEGKYYVLYKKLYVKDATSREPLDQYKKYEDFLADSGSTYPYALKQTKGKVQMAPRPYVFLCNGTWDIYNEGTEENPIYYRYRTNSPRASYTVALALDEDMTYYGEPRLFDNVAMNEAHGWFRRYSNWDTRAKETDVTNARSAINIRMIRLAAVYLWYAECLLEGGATSDDAKVKEAMMYVNRLRKRAGTVLIGNASDDVTGEFAGLSFQGGGDPDDSYDKEANAGETASSYEFADLYKTGDATIINTASTVMKHIMYFESPLEVAQDGFFQRFIDLRRWNVISDRFKEIGNQQIFEAQLIPLDVNRKPINAKGLALNSTSSYIIDYDKSVPLMATKAYDNQFDAAAAGYNDTYAYFPIPNMEVVSNPNITTVVDAVPTTEE